MKRLLFLLLLPIFSIYSQSEEINISELGEKEIIELIDNSINERVRDIDLVLMNLDNRSETYKNLEKYILNKAQSMLEGDELDYPLYLVESVLYNNLENSDAQDLYTIIINKQIEIKKRKLKEEERRKEIEEKKKSLQVKVEDRYAIELEMEEIYNNTMELVNKRNKKEDSKPFRNHINHNYLYPLSLSYYSSQVNDEYVNRDSVVHSVNGFSMDLSTELAYRVLGFRLNLSLLGNYNNKSDEAVENVNGDISLWIRFTPLPFPLYIGGGFYLNHYNFSSVNSSNMAVTTLPTPIAGISIFDLKFLWIMRFDLSANYMLTALNTDSLDHGFLGKAYLTISLGRVERYSFEIRGGLDYQLLIEGGLYESLYSPKVGIGVSIYE